MEWIIIYVVIAIVVVGIVAFCISLKNTFASFRSHPLIKDFCARAAKKLAKETYRIGKGFFSGSVSLEGMSGRMGEWDISSVEFKTANIQISKFMKERIAIIACEEIVGILKRDLLPSVDPIDGRKYVIQTEIKYDDEYGEYKYLIKCRKQ